MKLSNAGKVFLGFLAGAYAGALVAVLTTPKSGRKVRRELRKFGKDLGEKAREVGERAWGGLEQRAEAAGDGLKQGAKELAKAVSGK
jgi:gas vesicle protein